VRIERVRLLHFADMQFRGQSHILTVPLPGTDVSRDALQKLFDRVYWERFAVELPEIRAVLVNIHTSAFAV
jgi:N-methylhydantoinase A